MKDRPIKSYICEIERILDSGKGETIFLNAYDLRKIKTILEQIKSKFGDITEENQSHSQNHNLPVYR